MTETFIYEKFGNSCLRRSGCDCKELPDAAILSASAAHTLTYGGFCASSKAVSKFLIYESWLERETIVLDQRLRREPNELISVNKEWKGEPESKRINNDGLAEGIKNIIATTLVVQRLMRILSTANLCKYTQSGEWTAPHYRVAGRYLLPMSK